MFPGVVKVVFSSHLLFSFQGEALLQAREHEIKPWCRSLTTRQREILQQYADDVEGRSSAPPQPICHPQLRRVLIVVVVVAHCTRWTVLR